MKFKIFLVLSLCLTAFALLPDRIITGTVRDASQNALAGVLVCAKGSQVTATTDQKGNFSIKVPVLTRWLVFKSFGYLEKQVSVGSDSVLLVTLKSDAHILEEVAVLGQPPAVKKTDFSFAKTAGAQMPNSVMSSALGYARDAESYKMINENGFQVAAQTPVTTFSVDVDRASYSNVRRFLNMGQMPPIDAVRIEEMINYFEYEYPQPTGARPISLMTEMTDSPWNPGLKLVHIGLQAKTVPVQNLPASNLVFLIDVSGSMMDQNKLPLLKEAFKLLVDQLRTQDKIAIVAYAGAAGMILPPTSGGEKMKIREALDNLEAGGSTAGGEGIELAYKLARENFLEKGNNRVILATDGDFNVGVSSEADLQRLIEQKRKEGVFLSIMGFGMGNYKDSHIETLADKGNGNYAYIDNIQEARKEFVQEFGGTLFTVAKDVKIQIEFNPVHVQGYRLIGYENRALKNEEFHDDKKDAGDMGSGHSVTAIYEIIPTGAKNAYLPQTDPLKYQQNNSSDAGKTQELLTIKVRYKTPESEKSVLFDLAISKASKPWNDCSENLRFASSVAEFGLVLRGSEYKGTATYQDIISRAKSAFGKDEEGYRSEMVRLVKLAQSMDGSQQSARKD
jgi:Ca-activated chloride channel family protein